MVSLAAPGYLAATAIAVLVVVALHLLAWRRPRPAPLPTARFAPPQVLRAASRELQLQDVALLALRVVALLLVGTALSAPSIVPARSGTARVIVADASRRVANMPEVHQAVRRAMEGSDMVSLVRVDSAARIVADTVVGDRADVRGFLAAGIVAAVREGRRLSATAERVELVVVSPFARESWDSAAVLARDAWQGAVRVVRVAGAAPTPAVVLARDAAPLDLPPAADPVGAAFALAGVDGAVALRVRRDPPTALDSAWSRNGGALVWWPRADTSGQASPGTTNAALLAWENDAAIGRFAPLGVPLPAGRVMVRWGDGTPAATEVALGRGCLRTVGASMPADGDEPLRPAVLRLAKWLATPCGGGDDALMDDATLEAWALGRAAAALTTTATATEADRGTRSTTDQAREGRLGAQARRPAPLVPPSASLARAVLLLAAAVLLVEGWWRRRRAPGPAGDARAVGPTDDSREAA